MNKCGYCGHAGDDVNKFGSYHVGGKPDVYFPRCNDGKACGDRVMAKKPVIAALCPTWLQEFEKERY